MRGAFELSDYFRVKGRNYVDVFVVDSPPRFDTRSLSYMPFDDSTLSLDNFAGFDS